MTSSRAPVQTEAPVAHLGGGRSARLAAVTVAIVLVAVVWVGASGRVVTPTQPPHSPIVAVAPDASAPTSGLPGPERPTAELESSALTEPPLALSTPRPSRSPPAPPETYGVNALIGSARYIGVLEELEPDYLSTTVRVPLPTDSRRGTLAISQLFVGRFPDPSPVLGSWKFPLRALSAVDRDRKLVIDATVPADPSLVDAPPIVRRGYDVKVYAENDLLFGLLTVEVTMRPIADLEAAQSRHGRG